MKERIDKYEQKKEKEIKELVLKIEKKEIDIKQLTDTQKDDLIYYYNKQIYFKKQTIQEMRNKIKKGC